MPKGIYIGDTTNKARKVKKIYIGDANNKARKVKKIYIGDSNNVARLAWSSNGVAISAGYSGDNVAIYITKDGGNTWTQTTTFTPTKIQNYTGGQIQSLKYLNGLYVLVTNFAVHYSTDGYSWTERVLVDSSGYRLYDIAYGDGKWLIVGSIFYSYISTDNLVSFTKFSSISGGNTFTNMYRAAYGNGMFLAPGVGSGSYAYKLEGLSFNFLYTLGTTTRPARVTFGNGNFLFQVQGSYYYYVTTDGINYTSYYMEGLSSTFVYCGGLFFAYIDNYIAYSTNGINWTKTETYIQNYKPGDSGITFDGASYIAVCSSFSDVYTSNDGKTWTEPTRFSNTVMSMITSKGD